MITPILKDPRAHGGTLYTFPSASRDLTRAFSNSEYEFSFSNFACLNLPDFRYGNFNDGDLKGVYLDNLIKYYYSNSDSDLLMDSDSDSLSDFSLNYLNKCLKWHLQSYVMNYEIAILNGFSLDEGKYDTEILRTPSERIFFNWLQKVGAIKFNGTSETLNGYGDDADVEYKILVSESNLPLINDGNIYRIGNKLYTWKGGEWKSRILVSKTVQYIGTIDMVNNVNIDFDSFNEIYLDIPAIVGGSEVIFDVNVFDNNYEKGNIIDVSNDEYHDKDDENFEYIIGRNPVKLNMTDDVTLKAIYDSKYDHDTGFDSPTYKIDNGYCINFDDNEYKKYGGSIEEMNLKSEEDFEFNCVLIYYRIRKGNGKWYNNLYGVLFLEEVSTSDYNTDINKDNERGGYIQRYPKFKNGNSWGLKLDLKIDAQPDSQMELRDKLYDDPNGGGTGMQMFTEALMQLNDCAKLFYDVKKENTDIEERLYKLENMVSGIDTVYELRDEVSVLRTKVEMFQPVLDLLSGRVDDVENKLSRFENNFGYLIRDIEQNKNIISDLERRVNGEIDSVKSDINTINGNIETIDGNIDAINGEIDSVKSDINTIDGNIETINGEIDSVKSDINTINGNIKTINGNIETINGEIDSVEGMVNAIQTSVEITDDNSLTITI